MTGEPARQYSWPPFEPGNRAAVRHGARSAQLVEPRARELAPQILEAHPHLDERRDGPAVFRYCVVLSRIERVYAWLAEQGDPVFSDREAGAMHGVFERLERWERQAAGDEERLAIAPLTKARLGLSLIEAKRATLEEELAAGREAWESINGTATDDEVPS